MIISSLVKRGKIGYPILMLTITQAIELYLSQKRGSERTLRSYRNGLNAFQAVLRSGRRNPLTRKVETLDPETSDVALLDESWISALILSLKKNKTATESLYLSAVSGFYKFLVAERLAAPYLPKLEMLIKDRARKVEKRLPKFPRNEIEKLIDYAQGLAGQSVEAAGANAKTDAGRLNERRRARLRNLRDRAFILLLADTGLRVDEACSLSLGDVDFLEGRLKVIGKGNVEAIVRVSDRALEALKDYLQERRGSAPRPTGEKADSQPLFIRHDRKLDEKAEGISPQTGWNLVKARALESVGEAAAVQIHPHSFRHYFVTVVLLSTNNMEITRRLARHKSISVTQRYAEVDPELDEEYYDIFNRGKGKI